MHIYQQHEYIIDMIYIYIYICSIYITGAMQLHWEIYVSSNIYYIYYINYDERHDMHVHE